MRFSLFLPGLLSLWALAADLRADVSQVATPIMSLPAVIKHPGIYVLRKDLNFKGATGAAITIASSDVTLDLGGHGLTNTLATTAMNPTQSVGVLCSAKVNVTVRNGRIAGFMEGVNLSSEATGRFVASNLQVSGCRNAGISILANQGQVEVRDCRLASNGSDKETTPVYGIRVSGSSAWVVGNEVYDTVTNPALAPVSIEVTAYALGTTEGNRIMDQHVYGVGISCLGNLPDGSNFAVGNHIANCVLGIGFANGGTGKYRDNLTINCVTSFAGGTAVGTNN